MCFVILTNPYLSNINLVISLLYAVASGWNKPMSSGWNWYIECGGIIAIIMWCLSAHLINFILTWLECPSTINRRRWFLALSFVCLWNTCSNYWSPSSSKLHPFDDEAKYASCSSIKSLTQELIKSCDSLL